MKRFNRLHAPLPAVPRAGAPAMTTAARAATGRDGRRSPEPRRGRRNLASVIAFLAAILLPYPAVAQAAIDKGDTAWMLVATVLVLLMTLPGLALFYAGMVRSKNVLSVLMQCFALAALVSVLWGLYGYSLALTGTGALLGGTERLLLHGLHAGAMAGEIPEAVFMAFQMTFAIITPALIVGAVAERMKFSALLLFTALWFSFVYVPVCHWVWGEGGWLGGLGVLDFAGGTVVHINAGVAGLVAAIMLGKRSGYPNISMRPNNLAYTVLGGSLLWVGWMGFNGGSGLAADGVAGMAIVVTQLAAAAAALVWMSCEWMRYGKPTVLGIASGAIAGLVAITPAAGSVNPLAALIIGAAAGGACYYASVSLKRAMGYDDSLDVFGVHAVGGIVGALLTAPFAAESMGGNGFGADIQSIGGQLAAQATGIVVTIGYCAVLSAVFIWATKLLCQGARVNEEEETEGLDIVLHDERGYNL